MFHPHNYYQAKLYSIQNGKSDLGKHSCLTHKNGNELDPEDEGKSHLPKRLLFNNYIVDYYGASKAKSQQALNTKASS